MSDRDVACSDADALAGALAFGALDPAEDRGVRDHLMTCGEQHGELRTALGAGLALAGTLEPLNAPSALRSRIMQSVAETGRERSQPARATFPAARSSWLPRLVTLAAGTAVVAVAVWNVNLQNQLAARDAQLERLTAVLAAGAPAYLASGEAGSGYLITTSDPILVAALSPTESGHLYQMWLIGTDGVPVGVGTFTVAGGETTVTQLEQSVTGFSTFALTVEESRVEAPTTAPVLVAPLGS